MEQSKFTILFIDDETQILRLFKEWSEMLFKGNVHLAQSAEDGIVKIDNNNIDLIISDNSMPGKSGLEVYQYIKDKGLVVPFILTSGDRIDNNAQVKEALSTKSFFLMHKPFDWEQLFDFINGIIEKL